MKTVTPEMNELLRSCAATDESVARNQLVELAKALTLPLKQGVLRGDNLAGIYSEQEFAPGVSPEYPLDLLSPGSEKEHIAYTIPNHGRIPEKHVEGDFLMVPTFQVGASIDSHLKYLRDARWDIVGRMMTILEGAFTYKRNTDGWRTILAAVYGRNISVYDDAATAGLFTKRLLVLAKTSMRRNSGGNSTSANQGKLTDVFLSPEAMGDIYSWDVTQVDEVTRRQIFLAGDGEVPFNRILQTNLHDVDEFGVGQEYENYFVNELTGTHPTDKVELAVGLDLSSDDSFVNPVRERVKIYEDMQLFRQRRFGLFAWAEHGFSCLNSQRVLGLHL
jgi:hypothetical protein